jgi:hypothetical protein
MKLSDIVTEQQLDELDVAGGLAKGLGAVSRGVGAVGGAAVGAVDAAKQGFAAGRAAVGGYKAKQPATATAGTAAPADNADSTLKVNQILKLVGELAPGAVPAVTAALKQNEPQPAATTQPAQPPAASTQAAPTPAAAPQAASDTAKDAAQTRTDKQAVAAKAAQDQMAANPVAPKAPEQTPDQIRAAKQAAAGQAAQDQMAANASNPAAPTAAEPNNPGAAAFGNMANQLTKEPAAGSTAAPAATTPPPTGQPTGGKLTAAQQAAMVAKLKGQRAAGKTAGTAASGFNQYTKDASSQRIVGANPDGSPKIQQIKASKINTGNNLSEMLAANIAKHKKKIAEERAANYKNSSIFTK